MRSKARLNLDTEIDPLRTTGLNDSCIIGSIYNIIYGLSLLQWSEECPEQLRDGIFNTTTCMGFERTIHMLRAKY